MPRNSQVSRRLYAVARTRYAVRCWLSRRNRCSYCAGRLDASYDDSWPPRAGIAHVADMSICGRHQHGEDRSRAYGLTIYDADIARGHAPPPMAPAATPEGVEDRG